MRQLFLFVGALTLAGFALACQQTSTTTNGNTATAPNPGAPQTAAEPPITNADGVRRVTPQEASNLVAQGKAIIVDSRPADFYKQEHIKGSTNIPLTMDFAEKAPAMLPKDKLIIFYCS